MTINISFDTILGILGLVLALVLYYFDLRKKIDEILINKEGVLTRKQACDLIDIYLDAVDSRLEAAIKNYAANDLSGHYEESNFGAIQNEFERAYDKIVRKSIRKMVSSFRLRGNHRVDDLIGRVSQNGVVVALNSIIKCIKDERVKGTSLEVIVPQILGISRMANRKGKELIIIEVDKLYPTPSGE